MLFEPTHAHRYSPDVEHEEAAEAKVTDDVIATMRKISETTLKDGGHAIRSVHAKSHGLLEGELEVADGLSPLLAQGLFAKGGRYPVVMRFSTIPGDILDDSVSVPRGLAIKIIGVEGARLPGSESDVTQDFVLVNGPAFNSPNVKMFGANLKLLAASTDKAEGAKKALSAVLRGAEHVIEALGGESVLIKTLGGTPDTNILGETYYSQAAVRWGDYIAKVSVAPASPELQALKDAHVHAGKDGDALRHAVLEHFRTTGGEWDVKVQLCTDIHKMPVENAHTTWSEDDSPYLPVGRITVKPQTAWSEARSKAVDDGLSFSPWHGLAAHQPLGSVMRARKRAYEMSAKFRAENNGVPISEPREALRLP